MIRQKLDEYLDDALEHDARAQLEQILASDPATASLLQQMKAERAVRAAALDQYAPTPAEAHALSASILAACHAAAHDAPAGRIGFWIKRTLGVAAVLAITAGAFALGRASAPQPASPAGNLSAQSSGGPNAATPASCYVLYTDDGGLPQMKEFSSVDDAIAFQKQHESVEIASGSFDADHPGSF
ncbi:MAG: anti-sigma factor family protein [Phycisphaerae bacterium]